MIKASTLRKFVDYNPKTGEFTFKHVKTMRPQWIARCAGKPALTTVKAEGYLSGRVNSQYLYAHQAAFLLMTGECPEEVDHINGNRADNRWKNLRPANRDVNCKNLALRSDNKSGHHGIYWSKRKETWIAQISRKGKTVIIGRSNNLDDLVALRAAYERKHGFHANHGRENA